MFIRIAEVRLIPALAEEARRRYADEAAPRVASFRGNEGAYLLEPVDADGPHLACTVWQDEDAARAYESSGAAQQIAGLIRHALAAPPILRTYRKRTPVPPPSAAPKA